MDENAVVDAVCTHLENSGHRIIQRLNTKQQGIDIIAEHPESNRKTFIEAKGSTSSRPGSARFGKPYTRSQIFDRVAKGLFTALQLREEHNDLQQEDVFLAVPEEPIFLEYLETVRRTLRKNRIGVLLVVQSGTVREI